MRAEGSTVQSGFWPCLRTLPFSPSALLVSPSLKLYCSRKETWCSLAVWSESGDSGACEQIILLLIHLFTSIAYTYLFLSVLKLAKVPGMNTALLLCVSLPFFGSWGCGTSAVLGLQLFLIYLQAPENCLRFQNSLERQCMYLRCHV